MLASQSQLSRWHQKATVRVQPRREFCEVYEQERDKFLYSPELSNFSNHSLVLERGGEFQKLMVHQHFNNYMHFTEMLEHKAVNKVAECIAHNGFDFKFTKDVQLQGHSTYTDEAYHSLVCAESLNQIESLTGVVRSFRGKPQFLKRLNKLLSETSNKMEKKYMRLFFSVVSETMISKTLKDVPKDNRVFSPVREILADHAVDEGQHHKFFMQVFKLVWPSLDARQKAHVGGQLPQYIRAFIDPDVDAIGTVLCAEGYTVDQACQIISESHPEANAHIVARDAASATMRLFTNSGVLDNREIYDAFATFGLVD